MRLLHEHKVLFAHAQMPLPSLLERSRLAVSRTGAACFTIYNHTFHAVLTAASAATAPIPAPCRGRVVHVMTRRVIWRRERIERAGKRRRKMAMKDNLVKEKKKLMTIVVMV